MPIFPLCTYSQLYPPMLVDILMPVFLMIVMVMIMTLTMKNQIMQVKLAGIVVESPLQKHLFGPLS